MPKIAISGNTLFLLILGGIICFCSDILVYQFFGCAPGQACAILDDFNVAYLPARALVSGNLAAVYDIAGVEHWLARPESGGFHPTLYPPYSLFLFYPLGWFSFTTAAIIWFSFHIILLVCIARLRCVQALLADIPFFYILLFFAPFCIQAILSAQVGVLCVALFLLVLGLRRAHPVLAGVAFSMLCFKPQLVLALALLLLCEKNRIAIITIILCILLATAASIALWGETIWLDYTKVSLLASMLFAETLSADYARMMASCFAAFRMMGISLEWAQNMQVLVTFSVVITLWWALKRCKNDGQRLLLVAPATFLLTPYAFLYDLTLLAPVCVLLGARIRAGNATDLHYILLVMLMIIPVFAGNLQDHIPYAIVTIACTYVFAVYQSLKSVPDAIATT